MKFTGKYSNKGTLYKHYTYVVWEGIYARGHTIFLTNILTYNKLFYMHTNSVVVFLLFIWYLDTERNYKINLYFH